MLSNMNAKFDGMKDDLEDMRESFSSLNDEVQELRDEISDLRHVNNYLNVGQLEPQKKNGKHKTRNC